MSFIIKMTLWVLKGPLLKVDKNKVISKCKQIFSFKIMVEPREKATLGY